ncbi:unnamed protein product [Macrosiphum euphorbiae]|uniref:Uncharacterized protein n=1 Tax=Macrosiphum euphorbiae TaxID=13131 RepID=A0AAV0VW19_9HEMI|nr:unnamed protein product [Macrosiphum euphorbiae]
MLKQDKRNPLDFRLMRLWWKKTSIEAQFRISNKRNNYVSMSGTYKRDEGRNPLMKTEWTKIVENLLPGTRQSPYTGIGKL